jgi:hypothetical protein
LDSWKDLLASTKDTPLDTRDEGAILAEAISQELKKEWFQSHDFSDAMQSSMSLAGRDHLVTSTTAIPAVGSASDSYIHSDGDVALSDSHLRAIGSIRDRTPSPNPQLTKQGSVNETIGKKTSKSWKLDSSFKEKIREKVTEKYGVDNEAAKKAQMLTEEIMSQIPNPEKAEIIVPDLLGEDTTQGKSRGHVFKGKPVASPIAKVQPESSDAFQKKLKLMGIRLRVNVDMHSRLKTPVMKRGLSSSDLMSEDFEETPKEIQPGTATDDSEDEVDERLVGKVRAPALMKRLFPTGALDRKRSLSTNKIPLFESKPMYPTSNLGRIDSEESMDGKSNGMDQATILDAKVLAAITKKLTTELEILNDKKKRQKEFNSNKSFQLESLKISRKAKMRYTRDARNEFPQLLEKRKVLMQFLTEDSRAIYTKEKTRNSVLLAAASSFMNKMNKVIQTRREHIEDIKNAKEETIQQHKITKGKRDEIKLEYHKLKDDIRFLKAELEILQDEVNRKMEDKMVVVQNNVLLDSEIQIKDIEILMRALNKRQTMGFQIASIKELDVIDLNDCNLNRLPLMQLNTEVVKHVNVGKNQLKTLDQIDMFTELESLVTDNNALVELNLRDMENLKALSIEANQLNSLQGLSKRLQYLNASANKFNTLDGIDSAPDLRILILNNSALRDFSSLRYLVKLIYIDLSTSGLSESCLEELYRCSCLQYIDASNNLFRGIPEISNQALYELRLNANMISQLTRTPWLFNLRVLHIADNQLMDIEPLAMCPFLVELNLSNNAIKEIKNIYSVSVCQQLERLDLSGNPIVDDPRFGHTIGVLFPVIKKVNSQDIHSSGLELARIFFSCRSLQAVKICQKAQLYLQMFQEDISDADYKIDTFNIWAKLSKKCEKSIIDHLGKYYAPYLRYLCSGNEMAKFDPTMNVHVQEKRIFWLTETIQDMLRELDITPPVTWDGSLLRHVRELDRKIEWHRVTYIQALWRAKSGRKKYLKARESI